jgi:hypothetical protein
MNNYFPHDSNARNSDKLIPLRAKYKLEGYGVYYMLLERLREEPDYTSIKDYNMLAFDFRFGSELVKSVIEDFGLFSLTGDGTRFYSEGFLKRMSWKDEKSEKARESAKVRWKKVEKMRTHDKTDANALRTHDKMDASKGKERKEKPPNPLLGGESDFSFEKVWVLYERKGNRKTSERKWNGLPKKARELAVVHIPSYVRDTPEKQYRKNFETYINQEAWNDEIILKNDGKSNEKAAPYIVSE